eukprot:1101092-Pleurochrysis_carterae.AAC.2
MCSATRQAIRKSRHSTKAGNPHYEKRCEGAVARRESRDESGHQREEPVGAEGFKQRLASATRRHRQLRGPMENSEVSTQETRKAVAEGSSNGPTTTSKGVSTQNALTPRPEISWRAS